MASKIIKIWHKKIFTFLLPRWFSSIINPWSLGGSKPFLTCLSIFSGTMRIFYQGPNQVVMWGIGEYIWEILSVHSTIKSSTFYNVPWRNSGAVYTCVLNLKTEKLWFFSYIFSSNYKSLKISYITPLRTPSPSKARETHKTFIAAESAAPYPTPHTPLSLAWGKPQDHCCGAKSQFV